MMNGKGEWGNSELAVGDRWKVRIGLVAKIIRSVTITVVNEKKDKFNSLRQDYILMIHMR